MHSLTLEVIRSVEQRVGLGQSGDVSLSRDAVLGISEYAPGAEVAFDDEEATLDWARRTAVTIYHPTGTCKMGIDPMAVVDPRLRVSGIDGLRVADASIMPQIVSGNTNAPAIMIGERASDLILEDARS